MGRVVFLCFALRFLLGHLRTMWYGGVTRTLPSPSSPCSTAFIAGASGESAGTPRDCVECGRCAHKCSSTSSSPRKALLKASSKGRGHITVHIISPLTSTVKYGLKKAFYSSFYIISIRLTLALLHYHSDEFSFVRICFFEASSDL